jgi:hypothetical protein
MGRVVVNRGDVEVVEKSAEAVVHLPTPTLDEIDGDPDGVEGDGGEGRVVDGRLVNLMEEEAEVEANFFVSKSGFNRGGDMTLTLTFPRSERDAALALVDVRARMIRGVFRLHRERRRMSTEQDMKDWYEKYFPKDVGKG